MSVSALVSSHEVDDGLWQIIEPFLPPLNRPSDAPVQINGDCSMGSCMSTGCTLYDVPRQNGTKSTVHRFHLHLWYHGIYDRSVLSCSNRGTTSPTWTPPAVRLIPRQFQRKEGALDSTKIVKVVDEGAVVILLRCRSDRI